MKCEHAVAGEHAADCGPGCYFIEWFNNHTVAHLNYTCPCGCGETCFFQIATGEKKNGAWQWDGNEDAPTLTPSIQQVSGCKQKPGWHGYLIAGQWSTVGNPPQHPRANG